MVASSPLACFSFSPQADISLALLFSLALICALAPASSSTIRFCQILLPRISVTAYRVKDMRGATWAAACCWLSILFLFLPRLGLGFRPGWQSGFVYCPQDYGGAAFQLLLSNG